MPRKSTPKRWRNTDARQMVTALRAAGVGREDITITGDGHLKITCPDGMVVNLPSDLSQPRTYANARKDLAAHGVVIPARGGGGARNNHAKHSREHGHRRTGMVTRWVDHETFAFVTSEDEVAWFVSKRLLRPDVRDSLAFGRLVTFAGNPVPDLHQRYPQARDLRLAAPQRGEETA